MTHTKFGRIARRYYNKFTILLVASILLTLIMSKPANSLLMVEYRLPLAAGGVDARPRDIAILSGYVVFTEQAAGRIGSIPLPVSTDPIITEAILPPDPTVGSAEPWGIVGSGSDIYYTDFRRNRIGNTVVGFGTIEEWIIPTGSSGPRGIAIDASSNVWFVEALANKIGTLNLVSGQFKEWELQNSGSTPNDIVVVGDIVYFTEYGSDRIGVFDRTEALNPSNPTLTIKEFRLQSGSKPWSLVVGDQGMIWFTCSGRNVIGVLNPYTGQITEHRSIPTDNSEPRGIAFDSTTGEVWFTEYAGHRVTKYVPAENIFYEYPTNTGGSSPSDIALVGRLSPTDPIDVWFTEYGTNCIGEIVQGDPIVSYGTTSTTTVTTVTSAVSASFIAASSSTTRNVASVSTVTAPVTPQSSASTISGTNTISSIRSDTAYRLSTSTLGTTTSFIVEVVYTSATTTEVSTSYISTTSITSSTTKTSTSTSYIGTTSITSTSTSVVIVNTETIDRTSTTALSIPNTLSTTVTQTKYLTTVSGSTSTTSTSTLQLTSTEISATTIPTTVSGTTTSSRTTTTYTIPPFPALPGGIPGYPIESIIVGIGLAATFLIILSRRRRSRS